jgi:ATP-dependent Zn protease
MERWSLSAAAEAAKEGRIQRIDVMNTNQLYVTLEDGRTVVSNKDPDGTALEQLSVLGVTSEELAQIEWDTGFESDWRDILTVLSYLLPMMVFLGAILYLVRRAQRQNIPPV